jgi:hypothetical protein
MAQVAAAKKSPEPIAADPVPAKAKATSELKTTAISIRSDTLKLLSRVASARQDEYGGRKSVSAVIEALVRQHWDELEAEVRSYGQGLGS